MISVVVLQEPLLTVLINAHLSTHLPRYRLSSGDSGSSEDDFYDKKEEAMFDKKMGGANSEKKPLSSRSNNLIRTTSY